MLDMRYVRDNLEEVKKALKNRGLEISLEEFARKENKRRAVLTLLSLQRQRRNALSEEVGKKKKTGMNEEAQPLIDQVKEINFEIKQLEAHLEQYDPWVRDFLLGLPNLPDASVPVGESEADNPVIKTWGEARQFNFEPQAHWDLGEALGILDFERAAKIAGARFALLKGAGSLMERALINFMLDLHTRKHGYTEVWPPFMTNKEAM